MKQSDIEVGIKYGNGKGETRVVTGIDDESVYWLPGDNLSGVIFFCHIYTFVRWAKERIS